MTSPIFAQFPLTHTPRFCFELNKDIGRMIFARLGPMHYLTIRVCRGVCKDWRVLVESFLCPLCGGSSFPCFGEYGNHVVCCADEQMTSMQLWMPRAFRALPIDYQRRCMNIAIENDKPSALRMFLGHTSVPVLDHKASFALAVKVDARNVMTQIFMPFATLRGDSYRQLCFREVAQHGSLGLFKWFCTLYPKVYRDSLPIGPVDSATRTAKIKWAAKQGWASSFWAEWLRQSVGYRGTYQDAKGRTKHHSFTSRDAELCDAHLAVDIVQHVLGAVPHDVKDFLLNTRLKTNNSFTTEARGALAPWVFGFNKDPAPSDAKKRRVGDGADDLEEEGEDNDE